MTFSLAKKFSISRSLPPRSTFLRLSSFSFSTTPLFLSRARQNLVRDDNDDDDDRRQAQMGDMVDDKGPRVARGNPVKKRDETRMKEERRGVLRYSSRMSAGFMSRRKPGRCFRRFEGAAATATFDYKRRPYPTHLSLSARLPNPPAANEPRVCLCDLRFGYRIPAGASATRR